MLLKICTPTVWVIKLESVASAVLQKSAMIPAKAVGQFFLSINLSTKSMCDANVVQGLHQVQFTPNKTNKPCHDDLSRK